MSLSSRNGVTAGRRCGLRETGAGGVTGRGACRGSGRVVRRRPSARRRTRFKPEVGRRCLPGEGRTVGEARRANQVLLPPARSFGGHRREIRLHGSVLPQPQLF